MKKVKIHCILAKAKRMNMPSMVGMYKNLAMSWGNGVCELDDGDHKELNAMWKKPKPAKKKKCSNCGGLG